MRFEKWQALGNDYAIVERDDLPFELTAGRVRALCAPHTGLGSDGVLAALDERRRRGFVADLRIFNPDGSEAELSGNGAREAMMYLRRSGWVDNDEFSIGTAAGEMRPRITGDRTCTVDMGRRACDPSATSRRAATTARGTLEAGGPRVRVPVRVDRQPAVLDRGGGRARGARPGSSSGRPIERTELFPNRTNVSFWRRDGDAEITARIFERGVGETMSSGTGATGAAVAAVLRGVDSPVTVHLDGGDLEVEVGEDLHVDLTGWAVPVYRGELSDEFMKELRETE